MADAKDPALELAQTLAERHVEGVENYPPQLVAIVSIRHQHGGECARIFGRVPGENLQAPSLHRAACCFSMTLMAREDVVESFFEKHTDCLAQAIEQIGTRRVGKEAALIGDQHRT